MVDRRLEMHEILCDILGSRNVYFQPPESIKMRYPAIVYKRVGYRIINADNKRHIKIPEYDVIYISDDPDVDKSNEMLDAFYYCSFDRAYSADNLHHSVYTVFY